MSRSDTARERLFTIVSLEINDEPAEELLRAMRAEVLREAADMVLAAFHGEPFLNYGPDFAEHLREKASEAGPILDLHAAVRERGALPVPFGAASEFFRPGRTYLRDLPFRAPEDVPAFDCVGVGTHPSKNALRAFGFERPGTGQPWVSASQRQEEWESGWVDIGPSQPDRLTRTFAPTQALRESDGAE